MSAEINPYAPPKATVRDVIQSNSEADAIRQEHIKHETSIRSVGLLYYLSSSLLCLAAIGLIAVSFKTPQPGLIAALGPIYLALGVLTFFMGRGLRSLRPWARMVTLVLSFIGLLGFPVGTLVNGYILYLLLSQPGKRIFEADYPDIVAATPHVKYRTSMVTWVALGILILVLVGLMAAALLRR